MGLLLNMVLTSNYLRRYMKDRGLYNNFEILDLEEDSLRDLEEALEDSYNYYTQLIQYFKDRELIKDLKNTIFVPLGIIKYNKSLDLSELLQNIFTITVDSGSYDVELKSRLINIAMVANKKHLEKILDSKIKKWVLCSLINNLVKLIHYNCNTLIDIYLEINEGVMVDNLNNDLRKIKTKYYNH